MKYAISQIRKFIKPYHFEYDIDLTKLDAIREDVIRFNNCHIIGTLEEPRQEHFVITLEIVADLEIKEDGTGTYTGGLLNGDIGGTLWASHDFS